MNPQANGHIEFNGYSPKFIESSSKRPQSLPVLQRTHHEENEEGGLDLGKFFASVQRRSLVVAGVTIAVAAAAVTQALISKPNYAAKFELLINPLTVENKLSSSPLSPLNRAESERASVDETELKILQSPKLMTPVFKQVEAQYPGSILAWDLSEGLPGLDFKLIPKTNIVEVSYQDPNSEKVKLVLDLLSKSYLVYSLEERRTDARQGMQFVEEQLPKLRQQVETLQNQLQKFRQQHDLINPLTQGEQLAAQLNAIVQQRRETETQLARSRALYTSLQKQLQLKSQEVTAASALSQAPRYQSLLDQLQTVQTKISVESARYREDSPTIQSLRAQESNLLPLVEKERQDILGKSLQGTKTNSAALASPNSIRQQQTEQYFEAANQIQSLEAQDKALAQAETVLRKQVRQFPAIVRQNDDLERQLKIAGENLNQFLAKREALRIDMAQKQVPWQLLTPPTDPRSTVASVKRNLLLGTGMGLLLGIGIALLVDKSKNVFYTSEEVEDTTGLSVLGEIPAVARVNSLIELEKGNSQSQNSRFWESLRSLYTNIRFLGFDTSVRSLAIISGAAGDGRSTIAIHLAQTAAVMGQRVLLVDADLRNPKIHQMLGLDNTQGLSNVIAAELDFQKVIHSMNGVSIKAKEYASSASPASVEFPSEEGSFYVLTAGSIPPNPTHLLSSQKMQNLARQFEDAFDLVIYDTSPLVGLADSSLVAACAHASLLVVGIDKTRRSVLAKALEGLKISATPVLGVVANGIKG